jgi:hypothetical protein
MFNQEYLQSLIDGQIEENLNLDYKAAGALAREDKKTLEISKDISAFANSDGGTIVYGLKEDAVNRHLVSSIDPVNRTTISKEWLEQIITTKIRPKIADIKIHPIAIDGDNHLVVYLIEIPKSTTAHQAEDKRYYKRYNFMSEPMYDYEIRDILNRSKHPTIDLEFEVKLQRSNNVNLYYFTCHAHNNGGLLAQYVNAYFKFPKRCLHDKYDRFNDDSVEYFADNTVRDVVDVVINIGGGSYKKYGPSRYDPILPRITTKLDHNEIELHEYYADPENEIEWTIYADNAEPRSGRMTFRDVPITKK